MTRPCGKTHNQSGIIMSTICVDTNMVGARSNKNWIDAIVEAGRPPNGTQSLRRAFLVLRVLATSGDTGLGLSEIAHATALAHPTVHRPVAD
jgi:hypothetical protein